MTVILVCLLTMSIPALAGSAAAVQENPDIDTSAAYRYRADPSTNTVNVTITLDVTADKPNRTTALGELQYYFEGYGIVLPSKAGDLTITDTSGRALDHAVDYEDEWFQGVSFRFGRNLNYRETATVIVNFTLVEDRGSNNSLIRVNDAYIGFEVWTDPFLEEATVEVITPPGFVNRDRRQVGGGPGRFEVEAGDEETRFVAGEVDPEEYWAVLSLHRPDRLVRQNLDVDGHDILLQSWPGDTAWSDEAADRIEEGLPLLIDAIDLEWPLDDTLTITESFDPTLAGYGGWYDSAAEEISVGDQLDDQLMMHELAHLWFGRALFGERWIIEGLADLYAAEVVEAMGEERPEPKEVSLLDEAAIPLREWTSQTRVPETEQWAYPASWSVTDAIVDEIGEDAMDAVIKAAFDKEISYLGDLDPERSTAASGWRRYLDLIENRSGDVVNEEIQELFEDWVLTRADLGVLSRRNDYRRRYFELVRRGDGWAAPVGVRDTMARWAFRFANVEMGRAEAVLDRRDSLIELLAPVDAAVPSELEESYEAAGGRDMNDTEDLFDATDVAAEQLVASYDALAGANGIFQKIGAIGGDHSADLDAAADAFSAGDFDTVASTTESINDHVDGLARAGMIRSGVAAGAILLFLGGGLILQRSRPGRGRRRSRPWS
ncbi:MAG: hypothetical protein OER95_10540 [Acidimicrobiia bacterium]|nr:hypothetical protein [Acidimicrobiia bacterium]